MHHPCPAPTRHFQCWAGLLAAGISSLSILSAVQLLFASAGADAQAGLAGAASASPASACAPGAAASAAGPGCNDAAPGTPAGSGARYVRL